jgi:hypothetical protein
MTRSGSTPFSRSNPITSMPIVPRSVCVENRRAVFPACDAGGLQRFHLHWANTIIMRSRI